MEFAFLHFFRMHGRAMQTKRSYITLWNFLYSINSYPVAVVKYLYTVLF